MQLEKNIKHHIDIVIDRLVVKAGIEKRMADSIESVLKLTDHAHAHIAAALRLLKNLCVLTLPPADNRR
mgnify:CR=1 FL=1